MSIYKISYAPLWCQVINNELDISKYLMRLYEEYIFGIQNHGEKNYINFYELKT